MTSIYHASVHSLVLINPLFRCTFKFACSLALDSIVILVVLPVFKTVVRVCRFLLIGYIDCDIITGEKFCYWHCDIYRVHMFFPL